jgi:hypothetical protein
MALWTRISSVFESEFQHLGFRWSKSRDRFEKPLAEGCVAVVSLNRSVKVGEVLLSLVCGVTCDEVMQFASSISDWPRELWRSPVVYVTYLAEGEAPSVGRWLLYESQSEQEMRQLVGDIVKRYASICMPQQVTLDSLPAMGDFVLQNGSDWSPFAAVVLHMLGYNADAKRIAFFETQEGSGMGRRALLLRNLLKHMETCSELHYRAVISPR